ncbi:ribosome-binding factor A [Candidatus Berkelbacteria bacterium]|nr:ribosome-binding factor A [Candidatus Berkelbacteria bacterium]
MERTHRIERVNELLRSLLGPLVFREYPNQDLVTIVAVDATRDFKHAKVTITASDHVTQHVTALNRLAPRFQQIMKPQLDFRVIPVLEFRTNPHAQAQLQLEGLLDSL